MDIATAAVSHSFAESMSPITDSRMMDLKVSHSNTFIIQAIVAVILIAGLAAYIAFEHLLRADQQRRQRHKRVISLPGLLRRVPPTDELEKVASKAAAVAVEDDSTSSAPETPEQLFTPKQDRHDSRELHEVCDSTCLPDLHVLVIS